MFVNSRFVDFTDCISFSNLDLIKSTLREVDDHDWLFTDLSSDHCDLTMNLSDEGLTGRCTTEPY